MSRRHYKLPPFTCLSTFETAARNNSFKSAAEELGVTPGAVSHQIKFIEEELEIILFQRNHYGNNLTQQGEILFKSLQYNFSNISATLADLKKSIENEEVTISATTALSSLWLTPRLSEFWRQNPNIAINQHVTDNPDTQGISIDLKICYGFVENNSKQRHILFSDNLVPVCSPKFAKENIDASINNIAKMPLIHVKAKDKNWSNWFSWFKVLGYKGKISQEISVNNYMIALQRASDDTGVVLGWKNLVKPKIDDGSLVVLGNTSIPAPTSIYIMSEKEKLLSNNIRILRDFLIKES